MRTIRVFIILAAVVALLPFLPVTANETAEGGDTLFEMATTYFKPLPEIARTSDNALTAAKIDLGRQLYFDRRLSRRETISCNSCHKLAEFGDDGLATSPGDGGQLGGRNSPTVLNAALHGSQFWDGRAADVEQQAGMPILNPVEMAIPSEEFLIERLSKVEGYRERFAMAFPEDEDPLSYRNIGLALGAFERTLLTPSPFDAYLRGDRKALNDTQRAGLAMFGDLGCTQCHNGVSIGTTSFRKFGINGDYWVHTGSKKRDEGRYEVTKEEEDRYVFRVASLRNVAETGPYFHDGSVKTLPEAVRIMVKLQIGMELEDEQVEQLVAFLESLTGELAPDVRQKIEKVSRDS